jgi:hypothetical protein
MNDFKELLADRASTINPPVLDFDTITRVGNQRVRRRRAVGIGATALVLAGVAVATPLVLRGTGNGNGHEPNGFVASEARPLTWAQGTVIHAGSRAIDVGHQVSLFVEAGDGYVFADGQRTVWHWVDGRSTEVGHLATKNGTQLVSDGTDVAWVDDAARPVNYAVLHTSDNGLDREVAERQADPGEFDGPAVDALDGAHLYVRDARGALRVTVGGAEPPTVLFSRADLPPAFHVYDAERGLVLFGNEVDKPEPGEATYLSDSVSQPGAPLPISGGDVSPDGRFVMSENSNTQSDHFTLLDVATGTDHTPAAAASYGYFLGYAWVDADTYTAYAIKDIEQEPFTVDLLLCTVGKPCEVSTKAPLSWPIQLPVGAHVGD